MPYFFTPQLGFPLKNYQANSYKFKQRCSYFGQDWGIHLGEDINCSQGTPVLSIGRGKVVYSALHAGSATKPNWGNIIIVAHKKPSTKKVFFSLYAHLAKRLVEKGEKIEAGQKIGIVGKKNTPANGWWSDEHLHFAVYTGSWQGKVLPGYWKANSARTKLKDWHSPSEFIKKYA